MAKTTPKRGATATPINFSINVCANEVDPDKNQFKCKVVIDFAPPFAGGNGSGWEFDANKIHRILTFISDRVIKKVVEGVYYDRDVATYDAGKDKYLPAKGLILPDNYGQAMAIYDERRSKKNGRNDTKHLDIKERRAKRRLKDDADDEDCIECIVNKFFKMDKRPVWNKEKSVTRITFEQMSPPSLTVETRTAVNGDKKPK
jgi:hypothetical protein